MGELGIVVIHKEKGYTSHDVVAVVRRTLKLKAGHTGTLDPQAEGVLPVCVGKATRLADYFSAADKAYTATVHLGIATDTGDTSGTVLRVVPVDFDTQRISEAVLSFMGEQFQTPPMYSAIKVNGKKLYELARKGTVVEREPRKIVISAIEILSFDADKKTFTLKVDCSKGTYIRSLCEDIGKRLGCGACMGDLLRTRSGIFDLDKSVLLKDLTPNDVLSPEEVLPYPRAEVLPLGEKRALNGNPLPLKWMNTEDESAAYWVYMGGNLIGLYQKSSKFLTPEVMLI